MKICFYFNRWKIYFKPKSKLPLNDKWSTLSIVMSPYRSAKPSWRTIFLMRSLWRVLKELNRKRGKFYHRMIPICSTCKARATVVLFSLIFKKNRGSSRGRNTWATQSLKLSARHWHGRMKSKTLWACRHSKGIGGLLSTGINLESSTTVTLLINTETVTWTLRLSPLTMTLSRSCKSPRVRRKQLKSCKLILKLKTCSH